MTVTEACKEAIDAVLSVVKVAVGPAALPHKKGPKKNGRDPWTDCVSDDENCDAEYSHGMIGDGLHSAKSPPNQQPDPTAEDDEQGGLEAEPAAGVAKRPILVHQRFSPNLPSLPISLSSADWRTTFLVRISRSFTDFS